MLIKIKNSIVFAISAISTLVDHFLRAFWPLICLVAVFISMALVGVSEKLPSWGFQIFAMSTLIISAYFGHKRFKWPSKSDIENKITAFNRLDFNPYRAIDDAPATDLTYEQKLLWRRHRLYAASLRNRAWPALPHPNLSHIDKYGLRFLSIALLIGAWFYTSSNKAEILKTAFIPERPAFLYVHPYEAELWITPPEYTRIAPMYLKNSGNTLIEVPEGSTVTARTNKGWISPTLKTPTESIKLSGNRKQGYTAEAITAQKSGPYSISSFLIPRLKTHLKLIPDLKPILSIVEGPETDENKRLHIRYASKDDFGLSEVTVEINADEMIKRRIGNPKPFTQTTHLNGQTFIDQTLSLDLSDHALAGLPVEVVLSAKDTKGQIKSTKTYSTILPELEFSHPMARQLAAIRKELLWSADIDSIRLFSNNIYQMRETKDAYKNDPIVYLGLTTLFYRMRNIERISGKDIGEIRNLMWSLALHIDGGSLRVASENLQDALSRMAQALDNPNMTDEDFNTLQQQLESAMAEYMNSLMSELAAKFQEQGKDFQIPDELREQMQDNVNTNEFLQKMMNALENGSRADVAEALRQMEQMLQSMENMKIEPLSEDMQKYIEEMAKLKEIIRDQEKLLDETQTLAPPEDMVTEDYGEDFDLGEKSIFKDFESFLPPSPSETYKFTLPEDKKEMPDISEQKETFDTGDKADTQQAIREKLRDLRERIDELMGEDPDFMQRADGAMRDSRDALVNNAPRASIPHQERALRELKQGMKQSMQNMASSMGRMLSFSMPNFSRGKNGGRDPLGRSMGENGRETDTKDVDMSESEKRKRLRAIRDKIMRKSDGADQDPMADEYFDNLLERF